MQSIKSKVKQRDANILAHGYEGRMRHVETACIGLYFVLFGMLAAKLGLTTPFTSAAFLLIPSFVLSMAIADFISGILHWSADTWGSYNWPIVGMTVIRGFREHHVNQYAITEHDFIQTNGSAIIVAMPFQIIALLIPVMGYVSFFAFSTLAFLTLWGPMTNQIHKWAHQKKPARLVRALQKARIILPQQNHSVHHDAPFACYYCITTGWCNWTLTQIQFFRFLEKIITSLTGVIPREDDIGTVAAKMLAREQGIIKT